MTTLTVDFLQNNVLLEYTEMLVRLYDARERRLSEGQGVPRLNALIERVLDMQERVKLEISLMQGLSFMDHLSKSDYSHGSLYTRPNGPLVLDIKNQMTLHRFIGKVIYQDKESYVTVDNLLGVKVKSDVSIDTGVNPISLTMIANTATQVDGNEICKLSDTLRCTIDSILGVYGTISKWMTATEPSQRTFSIVQKDVSVVSITIYPIIDASVLF